MSQDAQDVSPDYLKAKKELGNRDASIATMIDQSDAVLMVSSAATAPSFSAIGSQSSWPVVTAWLCYRCLHLPLGFSALANSDLSFRLDRMVRGASCTFS